MLRLEILADMASRGFPIPAAVSGNQEELPTLGYLVRYESLYRISYMSNLGEKKLAALSKNLQD
jgi:hypothetical protein